MSAVFPPNWQETSFEKQRGVSRVEVRTGFAQVHVSELEGDVMKGRLEVLESVHAAGISLDFLKLTPTGMSFLIPEGRSDAMQEVLTQTGSKFSIKRPRSIVLVHAVNIRDEEGMIARIVKTLIESGTEVDHLGDMHDRMLVVIPSEDAERVAERFRDELVEAQRIHAD